MCDESSGGKDPQILCEYVSIKCCTYFTNYII